MHIIQKVSPLFVDTATYFTLTDFKIHSWMNMSVITISHIDLQNLICAICNKCKIYLDYNDILILYSIDYKHRLTALPHDDKYSQLPVSTYLKVVDLL